MMINLIKCISKQYILNIGKEAEKCFFSNFKSDQIREILNFSEMVRKTTNHEFVIQTFALPLLPTPDAPHPTPESNDYGAPKLTSD